jgi:hypothetical protein
MVPPANLDDLSHAELKNLVVALFEQMAELRRTIAAQAEEIARLKGGVSSTVIHSALESPARNTSRAPVTNSSFPALSRRTTWRLEMKMPRPRAYKCIYTFGKRSRWYHIADTAAISLADHAAETDRETIRQ